MVFREYEQGGCCAAGRCSMVVFSEQRCRQQDGAHHMNDFADDFRKLPLPLNKGS